MPDDLTLTDREPAAEEPRDDTPTYVPYLADSIALGIRTRRAVLERTNEINERITRTTVPERELVPGLPTINVPETLEKRTFIRTRLFHYIFGTKPYFTLVQTKGADAATGINWHIVVRELTDFLDYEADNTLDVRRCLRSVITEFVDYGLGVWKVRLADTREGSLPRWEFVSVRDLLWPDGHGTDIASFPWFGQVYRLPRLHVLSRIRQGIYPEEASSWLEDAPLDDNAIASAWNDDTFASLATLDDTTALVPVAEIWYTHPETLTERVADVHLPSGQVLRDVPAPSRRPYFAARFDERSSLSFYGLGLGDKLFAIQDITNAVYNIAIAAGIVSTQQARLVRRGTTLDKTLYGDDATIDIGPNFQAATEDPQTDLVVHPLGDPRGASAALGLLEPTRSFTSRMFGALDAQMGSVGQTRRAPAYGVAAVLEEGSMPLRDLLSRLAEPMYEAVYFTLELYARNPRRVLDVCGDDGSEVTSALSLPGSVRKALRVSVRVADPTTIREQKQQRALLETQLMMQWAQQLVQLAMVLGNPQLMPSVRSAIVSIAGKIEELTRRFIEATGDVQDLDAVVVNTEEILQPIAEEANRMYQQLAQLQAVAQALGAQQGGEGGNA